MSRIHSGRALPILSIVFSGVSLILFLVKVVLNTAYLSAEFTATSITRILFSEVLKAFLLAFPAVFMILYAALKLKRSDAAGKMFSVLLAAQTLSAVVLCVRMASGFLTTGGTIGKIRIAVFVSLFALMAVCCVVAFFGSIKLRA